MSPNERDSWTWFFLIVGAGTLANAAWMLIAPFRWYHDLPAGVPDFGDFNPHFVRDIGCAFLTVGAALVWAGLRPRWRVPLAMVAAIFFGAHALLHIYDTARGAVDSHHWWLDLPGVYLPALLLAFVAHHLASREGARNAT